MSAEPARIETSAHAPEPELVRAVSAALSEGGLVLLPTETVYGLAARADRADALERLALLKRRPPELAWTWHVGSPAALGRFDPLQPGPPIRRLVERYWPGPLTLVVPGTPAGLEPVAREDWTGVRCPAHATTAGLLDALPFPVVMTSVNKSGEPPLTDVAALSEELAAQVALIVDTGPARLAEPSSVLRVGRGRFELLRSGLHEIEQLRAVAGLRIGFACTGNTCRSPMAEGLARALIAERLETRPDRIGEFGYEVLSMGVYASVGAPAAAHATEVLAERGIDLSQHRSHAAVLERVQQLDRVYCMTHSHLDALGLLLPPGKAGNLSLLDPAGGDVPDPIGGTLADYRRCAERLSELVERRADDWA